MNLEQTIENFYSTTIENGEKLCPNYESCNQNINYTVSKIPKRPYIGRFYGKFQAIPRLLFLSLDSGDTQNDYINIDQVREKTELNFPSTKGGSHWEQTFDLAKEILTPFINENVAGDIDFRKLFVHVNSAKCTQNKEHRRIADPILFKNCQKYVIEEIPFYEADIIITQGLKAFDVIDKFESLYVNMIIGEYKKKKENFRLYFRQIGNKTVIHIPLYHPSYFSGYWKRKYILLQNLNYIKEKILEIQNL